MLPEQIDESGCDRAEPVEPQADGEQVPGVDAVGRIGRQIELLHVGQARRKGPGDGLPLPPHLLRAGELMNADGGRDVGEIVLVAGGDNVVVPGMLPEYRFQASCDSPCSDICRMRSASWRSAVTAMPPSPVVMVLLA